MEKIRSSLLEKFNGIILVNKPTGMTSYDILRALKKVFF